MGDFLIDLYKRYPKRFEWTMKGLEALCPVSYSLFNTLCKWPHAAWPMLVYFAIEALDIYVNGKVKCDYLKNKSIERARDCILDNKIEQFFDDRITDVAKDLNFSQDADKSDRITLYRLFPGEKSRKTSGPDAFCMAISRWSENPDYRTITNRGRIYELKGCLLLGCKKPFYLTERRFPDYSLSPKEYERVQKELFGYTREQVKELNMKSRFYVTQSIKHKGIECGIVVVESLCPARFKSKEIKPRLELLADEVSVLLNFSNYEFKRKDFKVEPEVQLLSFH